MSEAPGPVEDTNQFARTLELSVRLGVVFLLVAWCLRLILPFISPVVWAVIIAISTYPVYRRLESWVGGRSTLAASLFALLALMVLVVPAVLLTETLIDGAREVAEELQDGRLSIPPPVASVKDWPVIGEPLFEIWQLASQSLEAALTRLAPQLKALSSRLLSAAASAGMGLVEFALSIVIAAALLANASESGRAAQRFANRLAGERGSELTELAQATVRSVARGILGVAIIQSILAGIGFVAAGVPGAGLWALLCLIFAVVQLPIALVLAPIVIYVFSYESTAVAGLFLVWSIFVSLLDNVLKPILFGRGVTVPTLVIFVGAIGGLLATGIVGLFVGAVVLALGYEIFRAWLYEDEH